MEAVQVYQSSKFMLQRRATRKAVEWKFKLGYLWKRFKNSNMIQFLQAFVCFTLAWSFFLPVLCYFGAILKLLRYIRNWKLKRDFGKNSQTIQLVSDYHGSSEISVNEMVTYVFISSNNLRFEALKTRFESEVLDETLQNCLQFKYGATFWVKDENFCIDAHFMLSSGVRKNGESISIENFRDYLSELKTDQRCFPKNRPPWQVVMIPLKDHTQNIVVLHVHRLLLKKQKVLSSFFDQDFIKEMQEDSYYQIKDIKDNYNSFVEAGMNLIGNLKWSLPHFNYSTIINQQRIRQVCSAIKMACFVAKSVFYTPKVVFCEVFCCLQSRDNPLRLKGLAVYPRKKTKLKEVEVAWSEPVSRQLIENIANHSRTSVQNVVLSCCTGSLYSYLGKYACISPENISSAVAVSLTPWQENGNLNVTLEMATSTPDCQHRLLLTALYCKQFQEKILSVLLAGWILSPLILNKFFPKLVTSYLMRLIHRSHAVSYTKVSAQNGNIEKLFGAGVDQVLYWKSTQSNIGLHLSVVEREDNITLCVQSNTSIAPEPQKVTTDFVKELNELATRYGIQKPKSPTGLHPPYHPLLSPYCERKKL